MDFFSTLVRYEVTLWSAVDRELSERGQLSLGQVFGLQVVDRHAGQARVQELSEDIGITVGAASKLVDRLERDGLAARTPNPANRRSSLITLTPAGRRALRAASRTCTRIVTEAVGEEDLEPLAAALTRLQDRLDQIRGTVAA